MGELVGYKAVMQWFFSTHFNAVRSSDVFGRSEQDILREYVIRYDWVLKQAASYAPEKEGRLKVDWPAALRILGVKNESESGNKSSHWDHYIDKLDQSFYRANKDVHVEKGADNYLEIIEAFVYFTNKLFEQNRGAAERFWELFSSGRATKAVLFGNRDHSYAYFWLDVVRLQNTDETLASEVREWVVDEFKKPKDKKIKETEDQEYKLQESDFALSCDDLEELPARVLRLRDRLKKIDGSEAIDDFFARQSHHIRHIEDRTVRESKKLPEVFYWVVTGEDVGHVDLKWEEPGREVEPVDSGTLASVLNTATSSMKKARNKVLQVEVSPALIQSVFDTMNTRVEFYLDKLIANVSGFVLLPLIDSGDHSSPTEPAQGGSWYSIPRHDSADAMCRKVIGLDIGELITSRRLERGMHLYLENESSSSAVPDEIYAMFQNCLLFFVHENQAILNEFFTDKKFGNDGPITTPQFMDRLREMQLDNFQSAPRVFWQHPDCESDFSKKRKVPAVYCA